MLRSSLGFHTMTLSLSLLNDEADKLLIDFSTYRENTRLIEMYKNERNEPIIYYHKSPIMPLKIDIYFKGKYRGIKWCIRASENPSVFSDYIVEVTINPKILAGIHDYLTAATYSDMNIAIINFNYESKKISSLLHTFTDYKIIRIDYCINIYLDDFIPTCDPGQIMNLIKRSDIPSHYKEWMEYDNIAHRMKSRPESFYLCSKSANINYYSKYLQLLNISQENIKKGYGPVSPEIIDASRSIIRFEVQCKYHKAYSLSKQAEKSGNNSPNKYKSLLSPLTCIEIVSSYYEKIIGKGDWYTLPEAVQIIQSKNFNSQKEKRFIDALKHVSRCRSLAKAKASYQDKELDAFKHTLKELSNFNINPVTIPKEWGIKHIPNLLRCYFNKMLEETYNPDLWGKDTCSSFGYSEYVKKYGRPPI